MAIITIYFYTGVFFSSMLSRTNNDLQENTNIDLTGIRLQGPSTPVSYTPVIRQSIHDTSVYRGK